MFQTLAETLKDIEPEQAFSDFVSSHLRVLLQDMTCRYDEFACCATQGHKCGCIPSNDKCTSAGECIPIIWIDDTRNDCGIIDSDGPCKAIKVQCENCQITINRCSTNESKLFLLQNSNKNTTTCHVNNPSFYHLNLSRELMCISSFRGKYLGEIFQCENGDVIDNAHYAAQRYNVEMGVTNNSNTLVSVVQESHEKTSVFCRRKTFTIRRLSAQMVQMHVSKMASSDVFYSWTKSSLFQQNRFVTETSTVLIVRMNFCVPINQLHKCLLVMRGQDVFRDRCIATVPLNVWPWARFFMILQLNAKNKSAKGFVATSSNPVLLRSVTPIMRQKRLHRHCTRHMLRQKTRV